MNAHSALFTSFTPLAIILGLTACGSGDQGGGSSDKFVRPVIYHAVAAASGDFTRTFPARVAAADMRELNFPVGGMELPVPVNESDAVRQGQLLAQLDTRDYASVLSAARALAVKAGAALKPSLAVGTSGGGSGLLEGGGIREEFGLGAQVSWEIDIWGKLAASRRGAEASAQAAEAELKYARHAIAATTAKAYFVALEASLQEGLAEANIQTLEGVARIAQVQYDNGLANYAQTALKAFGDVETFLDQGSSLARRAEQIDLAAEEASLALKIAQLRHKEGEGLA